jgi:hypothetical protein
MKDLIKLLKRLEEKGFRVHHKQGYRYTIQVFPKDKNLGFYTAHPGENAVRPLEKWARNTCGISL